MPADLPYLLGQVRDLTNRYKAGTPESFEAFRQLAFLLLSLTVLAPDGGVTLSRGPQGPDTLALGGWRGPDDPLPLNDGRYLRLSIALYLDTTPRDRRLKVKHSSYQYQSDADGEQWIFRYDYLRTAEDPHPGAHLHIRGTLTGTDCLPRETPLERIHFPTHRVSLEAVLRLLADQFQIPCNEAPAIWRPVLAESEKLFLEIAHRPVGGPDQ